MAFADQTLSGRKVQMYLLNPRQVIKGGRMALLAFVKKIAIMLLLI